MCTEHTDDGLLTDQQFAQLLTEEFPELSAEQLAEYMLDLDIETEKMYLEGGRFTPTGNPCQDCGQQTTPYTQNEDNPLLFEPDFPWEWYMVKESVWVEAGMSAASEITEFELTAEGFLCIACLQNRLGRQLLSTDFNSAPVNLPHPEIDSPRLLAAKTRLASS